MNSAAPGLVRVAVRPALIDGAGALLAKLAAAAELAGMRLIKTAEGAAWQCDGETIAFELTEAPDQVEHVATAKELAAVETWRREREATYRKHGYWRDWGEPKIPKWERRYQGRLRVTLEDVRLKTERAWWGEPLRRSFSETHKRALDGAVPRIIAAVAAMAAAKRSNIAFDERRRAAEHEAARLRAELERRRLFEKQADALLGQLVDEHHQAEQLRGLLDSLKSAELGERASQLVLWAESRLGVRERQLSADALERRLAEAGLFEADLSSEPQAS